jgi:manganese transport protein
MTTGTSNRSRLNLKGLFGPALVAGVAYIDPGNIATNLTAGSRYGYLLIWVLVLATGSAALFQFLSAKLGLATGKSLPALLGERIKGRNARLGFWLQAEAVAIATDVAEVLGGAVALTLLSKLPLIISAIAIALVSLVITALKGRGKGEFNSVIIVLMVVTTAGFVTIMARSNINWGGLTSGLVPHLSGTSSLLLTTSIVGATIMPHAIYAHSALSRDTFGSQARWGKLLGLRLDVALAMALAGLGNIAIMVFAAANLQGSGNDTTLTNTPGLLDGALGQGMGLLFVIAMFASGIASSAVGNYAADEITLGLLKRRIPPLARWLLALIPALGLIALTPNVTDVLVYSQVVLCFGLPFALFPLVRLTANSQLMGQYASGVRIKWLGYCIASVLTLLNISLVSSLIFGH